MPYCPTHGFQQGKHCPECGALLSESPPAAGDSVRVRSPEATAIVNIAQEPKTRSRPLEVECPRCGHFNAKPARFNCKGGCGQQNLCRRHFDEEHEVCKWCADERRGIAKAEAARQAKLQADLAAWQKRAEQAETKATILAQRIQQAENNLGQSKTALSHSQERVHGLEKDLANWRGRAEKAEGELAIIEHARQEAEAKKRREIVVLKPGIKILDRYFIRSLIGEGGMARVWLAEEQTTAVRRQVAIKESKVGVQDGDTTDPKGRFEWEATVAAALIEAGVPNIVPVWHVEPLGSGHVLVMSYMPGGDLADMIKQYPAGLPLERAEAIVLDVLAALAGMYNGGARDSYIHRDVKPSNILFDMEGRAHLTDFGLAAMSFPPDVTQSFPYTMQSFGTPLYMAPECASPMIDIGFPFPFFSHRADLYSLGCVFWEMLTGKPYKHFKPGTPPSQLRAGLPAKVEQVVMKALAQDVRLRWQFAEGMAEALRAGLPKSRLRRR